MEWTQEQVDAVYEEAKEEFYAWEVATGQTDLSDSDRELWCLAYVKGRQSAQGFY